MSHFAKINDNNVVVDVIVAEQDFIDSGAVGDPSKWVQTSYNNSIRKNFAGIGYTYDKTNDVFIPPKPYPSWELDVNTYLWNPPAPPPMSTEPYIWDEVSKSWIIPKTTGIN